MEKKLSFEKKKEEAVIETTDIKEKLSFKDKLNIAGKKFQAGTKKLQEAQAQREKNNLLKLQSKIKKTKLQADLAQQQERLNKHKPKKKDEGLFGGGSLF